MRTKSNSNNQDTPSANHGIITPEIFAMIGNLRDVLVFAKDIDCKLVYGNLLLAEHLGFKAPSDLIGKSDFDIFPVTLAEQYHEDDLEVMRSGTIKKHIVELFPNYLGDLAWFVTYKVPMINAKGQVHGVCGTLQTYHNAGNPHHMGDLAATLDYIKNNYTSKTISNETLASHAGISVRQFEIKFKEIFHTTARQYILRLRILKACDLLLTTDLSTLAIATQLGFYDQSAFSAYFKRQVGLTPLKYQKKHAV